MDDSVNHAVSGKLRSVVLGLGSYLPKRIVSNADLEKSLETTDAWIVQRTGIRQRHVAAEDEPTSRLGRLTMLLSHPLTIGRALIRSRAGRR